MIEILLINIYIVGLVFFSIYLVYSRSYNGMTWLDEVWIGLLSLLWPIVFVAFSVARISRFLSVSLVDKILLRLGEKEKP